MRILQPIGLDFFRLVNLECIRIDFLAFLKKYFPIGTLSATYKKYEVVAGRKCPDVGHAVGYLPANGIRIFEG
jgi:hypothetical protein